MARTIYPKVAYNRTKVYDRAETLEKAYAECRHLIEGSVIGFLKKHHWDYEEALGCANLGFVRSYEGYDKTKGSFGARVCFECWCALMDGYIDHVETSKQALVLDLSGLAIEDKRRANWTDELGDLSRDAQQVAALVFTLKDRQEKVQDAYRAASRKVRHAGKDSPEQAQAKGELEALKATSQGWHCRSWEQHAPKAVLDAIMELGWPGDRVVAAFRELREALIY